MDQLAGALDSVGPGPVCQAGTRRCAQIATITGPGNCLVGKNGWIGGIHKRHGWTDNWGKKKEEEEEKKKN